MPAVAQTPADLLLNLKREIARALPQYNTKTHSMILNMGMCQVTARAPGLSDDRIRGELRDLVLGDRSFVQDVLDRMRRLNMSTERKPRKQRSFVHHRAQSFGGMPCGGARFSSF